MTPLQIVEQVRVVLVPFLIGCTALLVLLLSFLVVQRAWLRRLAARRRRIEARWRPMVEFALHAPDGAPAVLKLKGVPVRHRAIVGDVVLTAMRTMTGSAVARGREVAQATKLLRYWRRHLRNRRWWRRAEAVLALGLIGDRDRFDAIVDALNDPHEEVRAAAADALGRLGDTRAVEPLVARVAEQSRHQRVRIVEALRQLGADAGPALTSLLRTHGELLPMLTDVFATAGLPLPEAELLEWCRDDRPDIRAAAVAILGSRGLDDRTFYFALRALGDDHERVRTVAARALGRSRRPDAARYLADRLNDTWNVAAESARALRVLGAAGRAELEACARQQGQGADLAKQVLWEVDQRAAAAGHA